VEASAFTHTRGLPALRGPSPLLRLQPDEKLIALTRRGQHAAFEVLCSRYESRLLAFCRHMLGSREDAEDVLQEVFAAAFNAVLADAREINARPWLYRIARNRSLNHLRRASAIGVDSMDVHFADHGMSTSDRALKRESFRELLADVQQLPETQRTALLLREIDALSYEQIAHAMETTVPSVKSLLVRARISLAEAAEARKLSCEEVRLELGHVAEGLAKLTPPARRHVRDCDRCRFFKKQLRDNNKALAAVLPVAPLLLLKKLVLAKLGATASAGSAQVAGGAGATVGASAGAIAGATGLAGAGGAGSAFTIGASAVASKAVAGLAAAAVVGAGAVAADHLTVANQAAHHRAYVASTRVASAPLVVSGRAQPVTLKPAGAKRAAAAHRRANKTRAVEAVPVTATVAPATTTVPQAATPAPEPQVTQVTSDTTQLPPQAESPPPPGTGTTPSTETPAEAAPAPPSAEEAPPNVTVTPTTPPNGPGAAESTTTTSVPLTAEPVVSSPAPRTAGSRAGSVRHSTRSTTRRTSHRLAGTHRPARHTSAR
jgi:RNA polymerase sigma factor (sigma-70 family)